MYSRWIKDVVGICIYNIYTYIVYTKEEAWRGKGGKSFLTGFPACRFPTSGVQPPRLERILSGKATTNIYSGGIPSSPPSPRARLAICTLPHSTTIPPLWIYVYTEEYWPDPSICIRHLKRRSLTQWKATTVQLSLSLSLFSLKQLKYGSLSQRGANGKFKSIWNCVCPPVENDKSQQNALCIGFNFYFIHVIYPLFRCGVYNIYFVQWINGIFIGTLVVFFCVYHNNNIVNCFTYSDQTRNIYNYNCVRASIYIFTQSIFLTYKIMVIIFATSKDQIS